MTLDGSSDFAFYLTDLYIWLILFLRTNDTKTKIVAYEKFLHIDHINYIFTNLQIYANIIVVRSCISNIISAQFLIE